MEPLQLTNAQARALLECADVTEDTSVEEFEARELLRAAVALGRLVEFDPALLAIPHHSVIVIHADPGRLDPQLVASWLPALRHAAGHDEFTLVQADLPAGELAVLDEEQMRAAGWVRFHDSSLEGGTLIERPEPEAGQ